MHLPHSPLIMGHSSSFFTVFVIVESYQVFVSSA